MNDDQLKLILFRLDQMVKALNRLSDTGDKIVEMFEDSPSVISHGAQNDQ